MFQKNLSGRNSLPIYKMRHKVTGVVGWGWFLDTMNPSQIIDSTATISYPTFIFHISTVFNKGVEGFSKQFLRATAVLFNNFAVSLWILGAEEREREAKIQTLQTLVFVIVLITQTVELTTFTTTRGVCSCNASMVPYLCIPVNSN